MPIRVMHVLDNMGWGGMQNGLINVIKGLDPERFEHIICTTRHLADEKAHRVPQDRARVMCIAPLGRNPRFQVPDLVRCMRELKPDIVHSRNWGGAEAVIAGRWIGSASLIHSEHGLDEQNLNSEPWRRVAFRRLVYEMADQIMSVSHHLKGLHAKRTGFPESKITVIHNGVDTARFQPRPEAGRAIRQEMGISESEFCIGCVGSLTHVKDYPTVLQAVRTLSEGHGEWRLLIVGEGSERPRLEEIIAADPELKRRVVLAGLSSRIPELLNAMDVYVLPSLIEGISNSLLEAMASGLPVVATVTGGNPEIVEDGESGLLFPVRDWQALANHLRRLQDQPETRLQLSEHALQRIRSRFSIDVMVRNYERLYETLPARQKAHSKREVVV